PLTALIYNTNTKSKDYDNLRDIPRPAHADYTANVKYNGYQDVAGGGHFSGRLTAPLCVAGGICIQYLEQKGIKIGAHISKIGGVEDDNFDLVNVSMNDIDELHTYEFPIINQNKFQDMKKRIEDVKSDMNSVGGVIECAIVGVPVGFGNPMFEGVENKIASIIFGIPAVKGIEFGNGFEAADITGKENNDEYYMDGDIVKTKTNNHGGILGGITSGMPVVFRVAIKPTPSIAAEQNSISLSKKQNVKLTIQGRHDPCIVPRAVPVVEAAVAIALCDMLF
ncbi:MAG: chorismate synthase, partial [Clostridia bacterium]|nr:chorismate synthase [Clostridia bacterium]